MSNFVHLHLHTSYTLLDSSIRHEPLIKRAAEFGMPAVAMTDHGNMFGAVEFYNTAKKHGIKLKDSEPKSTKKLTAKNKVTFGFYSSLLVFLLFVIFFSRTLYFVQNFIITLFPVTEFYLSYFFESVRNIFEIWKSLIANY